MTKCPWPGSQQAEFCRGCRYSLPERALSYWTVYSDIVTYLLKINDGRYRMPNFVIWSASYASAKTLECEESISSSTYMGNYYSHVFQPYPPSR